MAKLKYSRQREAIKAFLASRKDHPTAEVVYNSIRQEDPRISLGTVYRNLRLLTELGDIKKISVGDGAEHFDFDTSPHSHFVCRCCQQVLDFPTEKVDKAVRSISKGFEGNIESYSAVFYGTCANCGHAEKTRPKHIEEYRS